MSGMNFNQEWYGSQAKVLTQAPDCIIVDYGCKGRGIVKNYNLFEGIQLCFLDFDTDETMVSKNFNSDIIQITHLVAHASPSSNLSCEHSALIMIVRTITEGLCMNRIELHRNPFFYCIPFVFQPRIHLIELLAQL